VSGQHSHGQRPLRVGRSRPWDLPDPARPHCRRDPGAAGRGALGRTRI